MSEQALRQLPLRILPAPLLAARRGALGGRGSAHLIERHARVYRHTWLVIASGFFEPLFYLLSIGVGIGVLVGKVSFAGQPVTFTSFVAPALLATSAMNGAIFDSTFNIFFRLKYAKLYDATLATPMRSGDVAWARSAGH
jgi:lipooligosaccharide transport system permease protein